MFSDAADIILTPRNFAYIDLGFVELCSCI